MSHELVETDSGTKPGEMMFGKSLIVVVATMGALSGCTPNTGVEAVRAPANRCEVALTCQETGFRVQMALQCSGPSHTDCFVLEEVTCDGVAQTLPEPLALQGCPEAGSWCLGDCTDSIAPGGRQGLERVEENIGTNSMLWMVPELRGLDGCDVVSESPVCTP